ncbi:MAG: alkaline phosphatase D family protein [Bacteroidota bacterium]|nr:alkaline phosphatase D family protein [Bacteroidota bacterium]
MNRTTSLTCGLVLMALAILPFGPVAGQSHPAIHSGPMIGHVSMRSVQLWIQTDAEAEVVTQYKEQGEKRWRSASSVATTRERANTAHITLGSLEPGTTYDIRFMINGEIAGEPIHATTQVLWDYRMDPPAFSFVTGSCAYINEAKYDRPGKPYGRGYEIFESMAADDPDMMLWLGDNIYLREVDFQSYEGFLHRYTHARETPEMKNLLKACPNYAIWDDHDFGPNDSDGSWVHADWSREAFQTFWSNPSYGLPEATRCISTAFRFVDMEFFLLDNRTYRVNHHNKTNEPTVLGQTQIDWLIQALQKSRAPFKFVCVGGQVLNEAAVYENVSQFPGEREQILSRIEAEDIRGVVFLSGDRHTTELSELTLSNGRKVYDLTVSPLTSGPGHAREEGNSLRVEGTYVEQRNYAKLSFQGPRKNRTCQIEVKDTFGETLWTQTLDR